MCVRVHFYQNITSWLFRVVTQVCWQLFTDFSGPPIGPVFKGQTVRLALLELWKWGRYNRLTYRETIINIGCINPRRPSTAPTPRRKPEISKIYTSKPKHRYYTVLTVTCWMFHSLTALKDLSFRRCAVPISKFVFWKLFSILFLFWNPLKPGGYYLYQCVWH